MSISSLILTRHHYCQVHRSASSSPHLGSTVSSRLPVAISTLCSITSFSFMVLSLLHRWPFNGDWFFRKQNSDPLHCNAIPLFSPFFFSLALFLSAWRTALRYLYFCPNHFSYTSTFFSCFYLT